MKNSLISLLLPLHPKLVHFPIALIISAMGMQIFGILFKKDCWTNASWVMFILAVISMPVVALSGLWEVGRLHLHHPVLDAHKLFALWAVGISWVALPFLLFTRRNKSQYFQFVFMIVLVAVSVLLGLAAHQGGKMVYQYGVGVSS